MIETSANIKEVGAINEVNKSMETHDPENERRLDEKIEVDHTLQEQETDDPDDAQSNLALNHVREKGQDGGQVSVIEKSLAGIEVAITPNFTNSIGLSIQGKFANFHCCISRMLLILLQQSMIVG